MRSVLLFSISRLLLLIVLVSLGCARFRIEELQATRLSAVPLSQLYQAGLSVGPRAAANTQLPLRPVTNGSRVFMADAARGVVAVHELSGELVRLIGPAGTTVPKDVKFTRLDAGVPGWIAADGDRALFIQYRKTTPDKGDAKGAAKKKKEKKGQKRIVPLEERLPGVFDTSDRRVAPSLIHQLNDDFQPVHVIGREGQGGAPFGLIYEMNVDSEGRLHVVHRVGRDVHISIYKDGARVKSFENLTPTLPKPKTRPKIPLFVDVETATTGPAADFAMVSVAIREKPSHRLVERRIYRVDSPEAVPTQIYSGDDARDFFGRCRKDGGFYVMNTEADGSRILFKIFSRTGQYLNNRLVRFPGIRSSWRKTYMRLDERIFTSRIYRGSLELYEWK